MAWRVQVPVLILYADVAQQPAAFLSQHLPATLDSVVPPAYARQVRVFMG